MIKALLLSAGLGTRLKPFTDHHPKALAVVNHRTILQRNIEYLASYGITDVIVNVHHFADQIIDAIKTNNGYGSRVQISDEQDEVLETGGGLKKASWFFEGDQPFIVMNVDILTDLNLNDLIAYHKLKNALEQIRKEELARFVKQMSDDEAKKVDEITKSIMQKIIKLPVLQLKAACKRGEAETLIDVLNDMFNLDKQSAQIRD